MISVCIVLTIVIWVLVAIKGSKIEKSYGLFDDFFVGLQGLFYVGIGIVCTLVVWLIYFIAN